jgi:hypothetical protein
MNLVHTLCSLNAHQVDFMMPNGAKAGQILHILVPGLRELQAVRVPKGAKAGMRKKSSSYVPFTMTQ